MKDAVITVRLPKPTRRRLEELARQEGRSLSAQVERLLDRAIAAGPMDAAARPRGARSLAGILRGGRVPTLRDFREARKTLSAGLSRGTRFDAEPGR